MEETIVPKGTLDTLIQVHARSLTPKDILRIKQVSQRKRWKRGQQNTRKTGPIDPCTACTLLQLEPDISIKEIASAPQKPSK